MEAKEAAIKEVKGFLNERLVARLRPAPAPAPEAEQGTEIHGAAPEASTDEFSEEDKELLKKARA